MGLVGDDFSTLATIHGVIATCDSLDVNATGNNSAITHRQEEPVAGGVHNIS